MMELLVSRVRTLLVAVIVVGILNACGTGTGSVAEGGIGGTGISMGRITAFGSVFVNGVEYDTSSTTITVEGENDSETSLKVGMVVEVSGTVNPDGITGSASRLDYADVLEGIVNGNDVAVSNSLTIMGQTVIVGADTVFDAGASGIAMLSDIPVNAVVEVSGFSDGTGVVYATRIEVKQTAWSGQEIELKGVVTELTATTFKIGNQVIDWSTAGSLPDGAPQNGWYVEVKSTAGFSGTGELIASAVEKEDGGDISSGEEGDSLELEGVVTVALSGDLFAVNGQTVRIDANTRFEHGDSSQLTAGARVEVKGDIISGELRAEKVEFKVAESTKQALEGYVESKDVNATFVTIMGRDITFTTTTIYEDERDGDRFFGFADIAVGDRLEIVVSPQEAGLDGIKVERKTSETPQRSELEGEVTAVSNGGSIITVLGVQVDISGVNAFQPNVGDRVEVKGQYANGLLTANSGEIE